MKKKERAVKPPPISLVSLRLHGLFQSFLFIESNGSKDFGKSVTLISRLAQEPLVSSISVHSVVKSNTDLSSINAPLQVAVNVTTLVRFRK